MANNDPTLQDIFNMLSASKTPTTQNPDLAEMYKKIHDVQDPIGAYDRASSIPGYAFGPNGLFAGQTPQSREAAMINHTGAYAPTQTTWQGTYLKPELAPVNPADIVAKYGDAAFQDPAPGSAPSQQSMAPKFSPESAALLTGAQRAGTQGKGLADLMKALLYRDKNAPKPAYAQ